LNFEEYYFKTRDKIEEALSNYLKSKEVEDHANIASYILRGGKKLRGVLACLVAQGLGADLNYALDAALAIELIHAVSLAQDDVIDRDEKRRGMDAAWVQFGISKAVLATNVIISHAYDTIRRYGLEALQVAINVQGKLASGVLREILTARIFTKDTYESIARLKTGALFGGAAALGAIVAKKYDYADRMYEWGEQVGMLYQLADDLVDVSKFDFSKGPLKAIDLGLLLFHITEGRLWLLFNKEEVIRLALEKLKKKLEEVDRLLPDVQNEYFSMLREVPEYFVLKMLEEAKLEIKW